MNKVGSYGAYQANSYDSTLKNQKSRQSKKTSKNEGSGGVKKDTPKLSANAKALLEELKRRYGNMDFMVASFNSDEEAQSYLSRGTKEYSVLIG